MFFGIVRCIRKVFIFESYELIFVRSCRLLGGRRKNRGCLMEDTLGNSLARNFFLFCTIERSPACAMAFLADLLQSCHGNLYRKVINV